MEESVEGGVEESVGGGGVEESAGGGVTCSVALAVGSAGTGVTRAANKAAWWVTFPDTLTTGTPGKVGLKKQAVRCLAASPICSWFPPALQTTGVRS